MTNPTEKILKMIERFKEEYQEYTWSLGERHRNGLYRVTNENEIAKFIDFLDDGINKLKQKIKGKEK